MSPTFPRPSTLRGATRSCAHCALRYSVLHNTLIDEYSSLSGISTCQYRGPALPRSRRSTTSPRTSPRTRSPSAASPRPSDTRKRLTRPRATTTRRSGNTCGTVRRTTGGCSRPRRSGTPRESSARARRWAARSLGGEVGSMVQAAGAVRFTGRMRGRGRVLEVTPLKRARDCRGVPGSLWGFCELIFTGCISMLC